MRRAGSRGVMRMRQRPLRHSRSSCACKPAGRRQMLRCNKRQEHVMFHGQAANGPNGELAFRALAMPADANPTGSMFGGWIMSLMDAAGAMTATQYAGGRVV